MKKIILSILVIFSIINSNLFSIDVNNNNNKKCAELPKDVWHEILLQSVDIKRIDEEKTLIALNAGVQELYKFSLISKIHFVIFRQLLDKKFRINGQQTLKEFFKQRKNEIIQGIKELLQKKYSDRSFEWFHDINSQDENGNTALMIVIYYMDKQIAELLIQNGADLKIQNKKGYTALMISLMITTNKEIAKLLIQNGAELNNQYEVTNEALMIVLNKTDEELAEVIKKTSVVRRPRKRCKKS